MLVSFMLLDDEEVYRASMHELPKIGETIWVSGIGNAQVKEKYGTRSFKVIDVCHWVGENELSHSCAVYVEPRL